jgi:hypothetical protein
VHQPDRPGADDEDGVSQDDAVLALAVDDAGEGLGQGGLHVREAIRDAEQEPALDADGRDEHVLGEAAVEAVAEGDATLAEVLVAAVAEAAGETGDAGWGGHAVAHLHVRVPLRARADVDDGGGDLVPEDARRDDSPGLAPGVDAQVGAADGARGHLEEDFARTGDRAGHVPELHLAWPQEHRRPHRFAAHTHSLPPLLER